ncbi:hypothetical protein D8I35_05455 [Corticibacter populi]|uniref:Uncharacterized protein n=1 Tax=Corticibacter populi TaxID=1550736 RepID=A0A3M6R040_9BURK|nr:hypothetical protein [Corticibacter populi]RMX08523.1 hypothetical protein D8I35_05455 [Corticibacter populi]RZS35840.1 hypothetical protein EV687_0919 [Corticibacter populi]
MRSALVAWANELLEYERALQADEATSDLVEMLQQAARLERVATRMSEVGRQLRRKAWLIQNPEAKD